MCVPNLCAPQLQSPELYRLKHAPLAGPQAGDECEAQLSIVGTCLPDSQREQLPIAEWSIDGHLDFLPAVVLALLGGRQATLWKLSSFQPA